MGLSLNPCFNGKYSQSQSRVLMSLCLKVLILVLMENTLREPLKTVREKAYSLNPCFNGKYSQRAKPKNP